MKKESILVVEDQRVVALDLRNKLRKLGYNVPKTVASGEEAIAEIEQTNSDLVLMDIMLKGDMDGIEAASIIKSRFGIPVIYITACVDIETLERAKATEPAGYISKPFKQQEIQENIETALRR